MKKTWTDEGLGNVTVSPPNSDSAVSASPSVPHNDKQMIQSTHRAFMCKVLKTNTLCARCSKQTKQGLVSQGTEDCHVQPTEENRLFLDVFVTAVLQMLPPSICNVPHSSPRPFEMTWPPCCVGIINMMEW